MHARSALQALSLLALPLLIACEASPKPVVTAPPPKLPVLPSSVVAVTSAAPSATTPPPQAIRCEPKLPVQRLLKDGRRPCSTCAGTKTSACPLDCDPDTGLVCSVIPLPDSVACDTTKLEDSFSHRRPLAGMFCDDLHVVVSKKALPMVEQLRHGLVCRALPGQAPDDVFCAAFLMTADSFTIEIADMVCRLSLIPEVKSVGCYIGRD